MHDPNRVGTIGTGFRMLAIELHAYYVARKCLYSPLLDVLLTQTSGLPLLQMEAS
jgi:hypothetical protein